MSQSLMVTDPLEIFLMLKPTVGIISCESTNVTYRFSYTQFITFDFSNEIEALWVSRCSFLMMVKWTNDSKMLVNDGEMLVNEGEMLLLL